MADCADGRTGDRRHYTRDELDRALKLLQHRNIREVAAILDRPVKSLTTTLSLYRRGLWRGSREIWAEKREAMARAFEDEKLSLAEIGRRFGLSRCDVAMRLDRAGLDAELRQEIRQSR